MLYFALCVLGAVLPLRQFLPFLVEHGLDVPLLFRELFATPVWAFFGMDVRERTLHPGATGATTATPGS